MEQSEKVNYLQSFADKNQLKFEQKGEVGLGRECVGFLGANRNYIDINPTSYQDYKYVFDYDDRLYAPDNVRAYHKHDCFCVLAGGEEPDYDKAISQLYDWLISLEGKGELFVEPYKTGAVGIQAMISGRIGYALRMK